ncbi:MAG: hypothetical protein QOD63_1528, partial [Actinomycetota bacterium]|nr:hypothetical protein [Actinomycetota bacterium]
GSSNTTVGYQIFANLNLKGATTTPTGTAIFRLYGPSDPSCVAPTMFTSMVAVNGTSVNSSAFVTSQAGTYRWTTSYSGDANYNAAGPTPCSSASADVIVDKIRNVLGVTAKAPISNVLVATATLSGFAPNGTMSFFLTGPNDTYCAGPVLFTSTVTVNGVGTYSSSGFAASLHGTYRWRASYTGDSDNQGTSITACYGSANSVVY